MAKQEQKHYDFRAIETRWQQRWEDAGLFEVHSDTERPKFYGLDFFPYPSGAGISVGHCRNYVPLDAVCRYKVMQGYNVLHPMGWDAFGQPAENEAIKQRRNPRPMVREYAANYRRQLKRVGMSYDWTREINSSEPEYYRWTQWIFLLLYKRGLAYRSMTPINWCPSCKTGLANEEVVAGRCWRCGTPVEKRPMPQWFFKITEYAERLLTGLDGLDWPEGIKAMQREWIGRSEGADVDFPVKGAEDVIRVYTTRPDTLWGATFMVLAPEHPLVDRITAADRRAAVAEYQRNAQRSSEIERQSTERAKTGVFTGAFAQNPVNHEPIPIWIADYVLMGYGTGAIMAVPAHDQRDFEFARKHHLPVRLVYGVGPEQSEDAMTHALPAGGTFADQSPTLVEGAPAFPFKGLPNDASTVRKVIDWMDDLDIGCARVQYRIRDWLISRQRYWGAPIPIVHCPECGEVPVPESQLPVLLPDIERYQPTESGASPLAAVPAFVDVACPQCGAGARRETDTMGGTACSAWYFLRFADPLDADAPFTRANVNYWLPVDLYAGGAEHAVSHLLYSRFWTKVLHDAGLIDFDEPFTRLRNQGMLLALTPGREVTRQESASTIGEDDEAEDLIEDWKVLKPEERTTIPEARWVWRWVKMSKSKGNVVTPEEVAEAYGVDSLRLFVVFVAPFEDTVQWTDGGIESAHRYLNRVWRLWLDLLPWYARVRSEVAGEPTDGERRLRRKLHQTIRKVGDDLEGFRFNTAVAALMELTNEMSLFRNTLAQHEPGAREVALISEILETLPLLLAPITPHLADDLWEQLGNDGFTFNQRWPDWDAHIAAEDQITIVVQINGKVRDRLIVPADTPQSEIERQVLAGARVRAALDGKRLRRVITVPGKLLNLVIG